MNPETLALKRNEYLNPDSKTANLINLFMGKGFQVMIEDKQIQNVVWENQEKDFSILNQIDTLFQQTAELRDEDFNEQILPKIVELASQSPLFQRLHAVPPEQRSSAHADFTPFEHSINVLKLLNTEGLTPHQRYETRKSALLHDLGKIMIAIGDNNDDHPFLSAWIAKTYLEQTDSSSQHRSNVINLIQYHHVLQALEQGVLEQDEVNKIIPAEILPMLGALSLADVQSVTGYEKFAVKNGEVFLRLLLENVEKLGQQGREFLESFAHGLILFANNLVEKTEKLEEKVERFINDLVLFVEEHLQSLVKELDALKTIRSPQ